MNSRPCVRFAVCLKNNIYSRATVLSFLFRIHTSQPEIHIKNKNRLLVSSFDRKLYRPTLDVRINCARSNSLAIRGASESVQNSQSPID